jgi:hypothetical protein
VLYVGDGDAESSGCGEGTCPFGDVCSGTVEVVGAVPVGADKPFPSALEGTDASTMISSNLAWASNENTAMFSALIA